jgi:CRP-like cAMP-binding protein
MNLSHIIGQRRHDLENRMENLVFRDVPARLASLLISLAEQYGMMRQGVVHIEMKLSQLELANFIGATRETTSTVINDMKRQGILDTRHRTIIINDMDKLKELKDMI